MKMAGALHPPFSLFLPEENEKTGRARSKREKEVGTRRTGARLNDWPKPGMTSPRRSQTGAGGSRLGVFLFPLSLAGSRIGLARTSRPILLQMSVSEKSSWSVRQRTKPPLNLVPRGKSFLASASHSGAPPCPSRSYFFFSFGPCTARFLFFFWKKKRKWGVQRTSHLHG